MYLEPDSKFGLKIIIRRLVVLRINVDLAIFQRYLDLEAGDNQSLKIQVARPGIEPRSSWSASQELHHLATAALVIRKKKFPWAKCVLTECLYVWSVNQINAIVVFSLLLIFSNLYNFEPLHNWAVSNVFSVCAAYHCTNDGYGCVAGQGECLYNGTCKCNPGYIGYDCGLAESKWAE